MDTFMTVVTNIATLVLPIAISVGVIGAFAGLAMSAIGYRHGSDVMRTSLLGAGIVLGAKVLGTWFQSQFGE
jgi:hypothetical protein